MPNAFGQLGDRGTTKALQVRFALPPDYGLTFSPEVAGVIPFQMPELDFHQGWRKYMVSGTIGAGGAGTFATILLRMPRSATVIAEVEGIWMGAANAEIFVAGFIGTTDLTTVLGAQVRDTRQPASKPGVCVASAATPASIGSGGGGAFSIQSIVVPPIFPLILLPSTNPGVAIDGWEFQASTVNQAYDFCLVYREWLLQEQENTP